MYLLLHEMLRKMPGRCICETTNYLVYCFQAIIMGLRYYYYYYCLLLFIDHAQSSTQYIILYSTHRI